MVLQITLEVAGIQCPVLENFLGVHYRCLSTYIAMDHCLLCILVCMQYLVKQ